MSTPYRPKHHSQVLSVPVRGLQYTVRVWHAQAQAGTAPLLVLGHGWMDVAASFQFLVDALSMPRTIVAPDWRGFGATHLPEADYCLFADYLLDLDYLLDHFSPEQPVDLLGHSMGGNIFCMYAGLRPQRVRHLVNVEGFGLPELQPAEAVQRLSDWMAAAKVQRAGGLRLHAYPSVEDVARRLQKNNPRLPQDKALWLAAQWAAVDADGAWHIQADVVHKVPRPIMHPPQDVTVCLQRITAPVLCVRAREDTLAHFWDGRYTLQEYLVRMEHIANVHHAVLDHAGHMVHHDQPAKLAALVEAFLA